MKKDVNKDYKYNNIADNTNRSDAKKLVGDPEMFSNADEDEKRKIREKQLLEEQKGVPDFAKPENIAKGKPIYLEMKPYVLQSPKLQIFGQMNNFAVCPFCKFTGTMDIEYQNSGFQKKCCLILAFVGCCICCWIPLLIRAYSDQIYKCNNCKRTLKTIGFNEI
jgi:hypothetical protein